MARQVKRVTLPSQAYGASASASSSYDFERYGKVALIVDATAVSGTSPTLTPTIEVSADNVKFATDPDFTMSAVTAVGTTAAKVADFPYKWLRVLPTIGGSSTPTVTAVIDIIGKT